MGIKLKYNGVIVIQSLSPQDVPTGKQLFDDIICRRCEQSGKASYFYSPKSKTEFIGNLEEICALVVHDDLYPIIHFEIHGTPNGLQLENGDEVNWVEIQDHCRLINIAIKNQLIITLATCWGSAIWKMIDITKPAPYWGYIGPKERIAEGTLMEDFQEFYDTLLTEENWDDAIQKIKIMEAGTNIYIYTAKEYSNITWSVISEMFPSTKKPHLKDFQKFPKRNCHLLIAGRGESD